MWGSGVRRTILNYGSRRAPLLSSQNAAALRRNSFSFSTIPDMAYSLAKAKVTTLPNGFRVASLHSYDDSATVGVWIDSGSRFEEGNTNGVAHFLEHMAFKGTKRRSRLQLEKEIENMGAHLNAYTSREQTVYYARVFKEDLAQGVDILSDILNHSVYDDYHLEIERSVILREMEEIDKNMEEVSFDRLHLCAFRDSPLGYTILGPEENIRSISRQMLVDYVTQHYSADRGVLIGSGPIDHDELVKLGEKHFGNWKTIDESSRPKFPEPVFCGSEMVDRRDDLKEAHIAVGFPAVSWTSPDSLTFMVMQSILGIFRKNESVIPDKMSSNRVISALAHADEDGCGESYSSFNTCYKDTGLFGFYAVAKEDQVETAIEELMHGIVSLAKTVTDEEVERGKSLLRMQICGALDGTTALAEDLGRQLLVYNRHMPAVEFLIRLQSIDAAEVRRVAQKYLLESEIAASAVGALDKLPNLKAVRDRCAASPREVPAAA